MSFFTSENRGGNRKLISAFKITRKGFSERVELDSKPVYRFNTTSDGRAVGFLKTDRDSERLGRD